MQSFWWPFAFVVEQADDETKKEYSKVIRNPMMMIRNRFES